MNDLSMKFKVDFVSRESVNHRRVNSSPAHPAARMLSLAYYIEQKIDAGEIVNYSDAARILGISRSRVGQIINLLNLSSKLQEEIIFGTLNLPETQLRRILKHWSWRKQEGKI